MYFYFKEINIVGSRCAVLWVAKNFRKDVYAMPQEEADENRTMRHAAYRQTVCIVAVLQTW